MDTSMDSSIAENPEPNLNPNPNFGLTSQIPSSAIVGEPEGPEVSSYSTTGGSRKKKTKKKKSKRTKRSKKKSKRSKRKQ